MAIVKANFVKRGKGEKRQAKATLRYITHRRGKDGVKITRQLFGSDGAMSRQEAYDLIDTAEKGSIFFRFIVSPDPKGEDTAQDLDLREVTALTMQKLAEKFHKCQKSVQWIAALHADHAPHRHVHILAVVPGRVEQHDLEQMRREATENCLEQRKALDLIRLQKEKIREREEAAWSRGY